MPYPNEHAARIVQPGRFEPNSFRRKKIAEGIIIIVGRLKGQDSTSTQAYRFLKSVFTAPQARKWLKDHNIRPISFEPAAAVIQSTVNLQGFQADFTDKEILELIPKKELNRIKATDPHPFFQVYSICHPGTSSPNILNADNKPITWMKRAIQSIKNLVLKGVKLFCGHNEDSSTDNRRVIGEVVHDFQKEINGELHHLIITYHKPEMREEAKQYDICSQEAVWNLIEKAGGYLADKIEKITGIALGRSDRETPAFAGAQRRGMVQAMIHSFQNPGQPERSQLMGIEDFMKLSFSQLKELLLQRNVWPHQIFTEEQIKDDKVFGKIYGEHEKLREQVDKVVKEVQEKEKLITDFNQKEANLKLDNYRQTAKQRMDRLMQLSGATDLQKKFVELKFDPSNLTIEQLSEDSLQSTLNQILAERQKLAAAGIITDGGTGNIPPDKKVKTPPDGKPPEPDDYTKAANNELLTEDL